MKIVYRFLAALLGVAVLQIAGACSAQGGAAANQVAVAQTPLQQLIAGNERYASGHPLHPHQDVDRRTEVASGQHPIAIVVGCSDSRVPPEIVFDQGLGDIFVVRTAGEVVDDQALGSIEYAVEHLHVHLIVVLGHENCGAVAAAVAGGEAPGHIGSVVAAIEPAVEKARHEPGNLLENAIDENVRLVVGKIESSGPILSHEVASGELKVVGARYDLGPGTVEWLTPQ